MNTQQELLEYIKKELAPGTPDLTPETNLAGVVDSTAVMEVVVWIESKYGIDVEIDDITPENFGTVKALSAYIQQHVREKNVSA